MTKYRLTTLGRVELTQPAAGTSVLRPGKPLALLVYLALTPAGASRDRAASLLWSRSGRDAARQSLRQALSILRKALGPDAIQGDDPLVLRPGLVATDFRELEQALAADDIDASLELWQGPFMAGLVVHDAPDWEEWSDSFHRAMSRRLEHGLARRAAEAAERGDLTRATSLYRAATTVAPLAEEGWAGLVRVLLDSGRREEAQAVLTEARQALEPGDTPELDRLEARAAALARHASPEESGLRLEFGGRTSELLQLSQLWQRARDGRLSAATLAGPAGIGKTRLVEELAASVVAEGGVVVQAHVFRAERTLEYGLATTLLRRLLALRGAAGITVASDRVLRSLLPSTEARTVAPDPVPAIALGDAFADLLTAVSEERSLLLVIEDMHWADPSSRNLIRYALGHVQDAAVLVLTTFRDEEVPPELRAELPAVFAELDIRRLDLGPLAAAEVESIVLRSLPGITLEPQELRTLIETTEGNPRFLEEALKSLQDRGTLERGPEGWRLVRERLPEQLPLPGSLREVIRTRLGRLSRNARALAGELALLPGPVEPEVLQRRAGLRDEIASRAFAQLTQRKIIRRVDEERVDFAHEQLREIAREELLPARRPGRRPRTARARFAITAGVVVLVVLAVSALLRALAPSAPLYGGGRLYLGAGDSVLVVFPPASPGGAWRVGRRTEWTPRGNQRTGPYPASGGTNAWFGFVSPVDESPYGVRFYPDGRVEPLVRRDSLDAAVATAAPDGSEIVYLTDSAGTAAYDIGMFVAAADGSRARRILQWRDKLADADWSPDGHAIAVVIIGQTDTLAVLSPRGRRLASFPFRDVIDLAWCGDSRRLAAIVTSGGSRRLVLINTSTQGVLEQPGPPALPHPLACSPDARAVVYRVALQGQARLVARDLASGSLTPIEVPAGDLVALRWLPDAPVPAPAAVAIDSLPRRLRWGERATARATASSTAGGPWSGPVQWESSDPGVISVSATGELTANRPGHAWIRAIAADWRTDSARVEVTGVPVAGLLLRADFRRPLDSAWFVVGAPPPTPVTREGELVLSLNGDGSHYDGIISRQAFALPRGAVLDAEVRIPLNRSDRQRVGMCLESSTPPASGDTVNADNWRRAQAACVTYPYGELIKFRPDELYITVNGSEGSVALPAELPPRGWLHLALQVRPDGEVTVLVNHRAVATAPLRLDLGREPVWRVNIGGAAVDTEALVRNVVLWDGVHFADSH